MRILFSSTPAFGHLLPLLPLAHAARQSGHDAAFLTHAGFADILEPFPLLPSGPDLGTILVESTRRTGLNPEMAGEHNEFAGAADIFAGTRVDLSIDDALAAARDYAPDLVVAESGDFVGPLVAAALGLPWVSHAVVLTGNISGPLLEAMNATVAPRYAARGLSPTPRLAYLDPFPDGLQRDGWRPDADALSIQPQPHLREGSTWTATPFPGREDHPLVLLTLGTVVGSVVEDPAAQIIGGLPADVNVVVTAGTQEKADALAVDRSRVQPIGFVPLSHLLSGVDVVVSAGGAGTVLAALSRGLPLVVLPFIADQPINAAQVVAAGAGVVVETPAAVGAAVQEVLANPSYRAAAQRLEGEIAQMNTPAQVLDILAGRMAQPQ